MGQTRRTPLYPHAGMRNCILEASHPLILPFPSVPQASRPKTDHGTPVWAIYQRHSLTLDMGFVSERIMPISKTHVNRKTPLHGEWQDQELSAAITRFNEPEAVICEGLHRRGLSPLAFANAGISGNGQTQGLPTYSMLYSTILPRPRQKTYHWTAAQGAGC